MPEILFNRIREANQQLERYHFHIEYSQGIVYAREMDGGEPHASS